MHVKDTKMGCKKPEWKRKKEKKKKKKEADRSG